MRDTFYKLVTSFAERNGCECAIKSGTCQGTLTVEGIDIQLGLLEDSGMILLQSGIGLLPGENREELYAMLLSANNCFSGTQGLTLGLDTEQELVTLQCAWDIRQLDDEHFDILMGNFLSLLAQWLRKLAVWRPDANAVGSEPGEEASLLMGQFLRV
ncbi:MAG: type III secretion system chaperone [Deltaproteobacteria bacterium]|nr:type III secretion system chaperone [Deltaproteobacteria bacterium]